jgi:fatty-acyl-CoA synthase
MVALYFGLLKIGAVTVPLNFRWSGREIVYALNHSDTIALLVAEEYAGLIKERENELTGLKWCALIDGKLGASSTLTLKELSDQGESGEPEAEVGGDDDSFILYTAGTTGRPKGVVLTHANHLWNAVNYVVAYGMREDDVELALSPLFHSSTLGRCIAYVLAGATFVTSGRFDPRKAFELIEERHVTSITQVPTMYADMFDAWDRTLFHTDSVRRVVTGGAPMPSELKRRLLKLFPRATLHDLYGITEASPGVSISRIEGEGDVLANVGKPLLTTEVKVVDGRGGEVQPGEVGELLLRGPHVMRGYYKDRAGTESVLKDGWLSTGDLGRRSPDGVLTLAGRRKDVIISGGENIFPAEVEEVLREHPAVEDACVYGVPHPRWGESVKATVVRRPQVELDKEHVLAFCKGKLAGYKCPRCVDFVDSLPRNAAGKVLRDTLKKGR